VELVAKYCKVSPKWLRDEIDAGRLPHLRAGDKILLDPHAVEEALVARARLTPRLMPLRMVTVYLRQMFDDIDAEKVRRAAEAGELPCVRLSGTLAFDLEAVTAALIERAKRNQTGDAP
jgi:hypothetical protein